jgi:hypothetical protein
MRRMVQQEVEARPQAAQDSEAQRVNRPISNGFCRYLEIAERPIGAHTIDC